MHVMKVSLHVTACTRASLHHSDTIHDDDGDALQAVALALTMVVLLTLTMNNIQTPQSGGGAIGIGSGR